MLKSTEIVTWCPFMVSIKQKVLGTLKLCGGTVLTNTLTLTAAHCLIYGTLGLQLHFGSVHLFRGGSIFEATKIFVHESFNKTTLAHDLGLVSIFPAHVTYGYYIQPVGLPKNVLVYDTHHYVTVYGWGAISEHKSFSEILRSATLPIVDKDICPSLLESVIPENTFCLGYTDGHLDACLGDSGGPAVMNGVQVGITSFGEGCGLPLKPGVYTDLTKYLDWLQIAIDTLY